MLLALGFASPAHADDEIDDILKNAPAAPVTSSPANPNPNEKVPDALGTLEKKIPAGSRIGTLTTNDGKAFEGRLWMRAEMRFRVWDEKLKMYRDIDLALIKRIDVKVLAEQMEDDWRWKKEGSDEKVFSGRKYPNVELAYRFTLTNDQVIEGALDTQINFSDGKENRRFTFYKKHKGELDQTLKDLSYIKTITFAAGEAAQTSDGKTTKLPLILD